jgi:phage terminase large subunit-like protein
MEGVTREEVPVPGGCAASKYIRLPFMQKEKEIEKAYIKQSEVDFLTFVRGLRIASQSGPKVFENCMALFQRICFEELASSIQALRDGRMPEIRRWWIERTKKASKDADLAIIVVWLLAFARRPFYVQVGAANKIQAAIVKERIVHLLHWNPWLNDLIEVVQWNVRSKKITSGGTPLAHLDILSSDAAGAHGGTPDLLVVNELSHVAKFEFVETLLDNADGVAQGMVIVATNAGFKGSKAEKWRNIALASEDWATHVLSKPAPWHSAATIKQAQMRNPYSRFLRLWKGMWVSGKGDALPENHIERCFTLDGPAFEPHKGVVYVAGLDIGVSHDHSGLVVLGADPVAQTVHTAWWKRWKPQEDTGEVDLQDIEKTLLWANEKFRLEALLYDPHQAKLLAQRLRYKMPCRQMTFQPTNLIRMAQALMQVVEAGKLKCYDDEEGSFRADLGKLSIKERSYGFRLEAVRDETGHADVGTALLIALPLAVDVLGGSNSTFGEDDVLFDEKGHATLTEEEEKKLPEQFQGLFEVENRQNPKKRKQKEEQEEEDPFINLE